MLSGLQPAQFDMADAAVQTPGRPQKYVVEPTKADPYGMTNKEQSGR
jgi:hypothetical protein